MATIPGSHLFDATASAILFPGGVNVVETSTGAGLPAAIPNDFNLEVYTGPGPAPTSPFAGYQGLAVLTGGGFELDLIAGAFAVTDIGSGGATLNAEGTNETITGGSGFDNLLLNGNSDVANGGAGGDFIAVNGTGDTVNGGTGPDAINVNSSGNTVNGGAGSDTITILANGNVVNGGSGPDTITAIGNNESVTGGSGTDLVNVVGNNSVVTGGSSGHDTLNVFGTGDTVNGGSGADTIGLYGNNDSAAGGAGGGTVIATGSGDTVTAGSGNLLINVGGANFQFNDTTSVYSDTVVGFSQASGDHIHLTGTDTVAFAVANQVQQNGGTDTLITLNDGSTILLKGVSHIDSSFFN